MKVCEMFESIQGEGIYIGTPSVFIRLHGCKELCMPRYTVPEEEFTARLDYTARTV